MLEQLARCPLRTRVPGSVQASVACAVVRVVLVGDDAKDCSARSCTPGSSSRQVRFVTLPSSFQFAGLHTPHATYSQTAMVYMTRWWPVRAM